MSTIKHENVTCKGGTVLLHTNAGIVHGVKPAESWAGYLYWLLQVPPFKPNRMLMLGYGLGTVAELTRKIWGNDVACLGIDVEVLETYPQDTVVREDAFYWIKDGKAFDKFDYIVVDLFKGRNVEPRVFTDEFLGNLKSNLSPEGLVSIHFIGAELMNQENKELIEKYFKVDRIKTVDTSWVIFLKHSENKAEYSIN